ncbi:LexA family protein [Paraburkholderia sp. BCC1885]|uniref:LexA family protein n=1 Tax=Paraburkholderia sp. BCC1885 TaxID=2562669 RepID=UPI0011836284|nr:hypothetical protein [Paraburkholderia sp. BCC1885]
MAKIDFSKQSLRITNNSMFDPAHPHDSFILGDKVVVNANREAEDGDFVIVEHGDAMSLMQMVISDGERLFRYLNPAWPDTLRAVEAEVVGVVSELHRPYGMDMTGPLTWLGDDIGLNDSPTYINLGDGNGHSQMVSLEDALAVINQIDQSGYQRISEALPFAVEHGHLCAKDQAAWNDAMPSISAWLVRHDQTQFVVYAPEGTAYWPPEATLLDARLLIAERSVRPDEPGWAIVPLPLALPYGSSGLLGRRELPKGAILDTGTGENSDFKIAALASIGRTAGGVGGEIEASAHEREHA